MAALSKKDKQKAGYAALSSADEDDIYSVKEGGGDGGLRDLGSNQIPPYGAVCAILSAILCRRSVQERHSVVRCF
jgi:hypothetical protein